MSERRPLVFGVVIPAYNRPEGLENALKSLVAQTYPHWSAIVVDDSGTGSLRSIVEGLDSRARAIVNVENQGTNRSRNTALELLTPAVDYVTFLDDDDEFRPDTLEKAAAHLRTTGSRWSFSRRLDSQTGESFTFIARGEGTYNYVEDCLLGTAVSGDATHFVSTDALRLSEAKFAQDRVYRGEWHFWARLGTTTPCRFFEGAVTLGSYGATNLSEISRLDLDYRVNELCELAAYLCSDDASSVPGVLISDYLEPRVATILVRVVAARRWDLTLKLLRASPVKVVFSAKVLRRFGRGLTDAFSTRCKFAARRL